MVIANGTVDAFGPPGSTAGAINDAGAAPAAMMLLAGLAVLLARRGRRKEPG